MTELRKNDKVTCFLIVFTETFLSLQTKLFMSYHGTIMRVHIIVPWSHEKGQLNI